MKRLAAAVLIACSTLAGLAHADAWDAAMARAAAQKEKALDADDPVAWQEALDLFLEADAIRATKESKYEVAFAASKVKATDLAVESYEASLALGLEGPPADKAKEFVAAHATTMARIEIVGPPGARVFVDGRRRGILPLARPIVVFGSGSVLLRVTHEAKSIEKTVPISVGEKKTVDLAADFAPPPEPAKVPVAPPPPAKQPDGKTDTLGWALVGTGAFVTVASGVLWYVAAKTVSDRRQSLAQVCDVAYRADDPEYCLRASDQQKADWAQEDGNLIRTFKPLRWVGAIGAGVGLVTLGIGVYHLRSHTEPVATITPAVAHDGATVTLRVSF